MRTETSRDRVIRAAEARGLEVTEEGRTVHFGYFQVSFRDGGQWWPECAHGPAAGSLSELLEALANWPDARLSPARGFLASGVPSHG